MGVLRWMFGIYKEGNGVGEKGVCYIKFDGGGEGFFL